MDLQLLIDEIQQCIEMHVDGKTNGITIAFSVSEKRDNECATVFVSTCMGCGCSRESFINQVGTFVLKLQSIDSSFNHN